MRGEEGHKHLDELLGREAGAAVQPVDVLRDHLDVGVPVRRRERRERDVAAARRVMALLLSGHRARTRE